MALSGKHWLCWQRSVGAHTRPQAPQLELLFAVSTQPLAQLVSVLAHAHTPLLQVPVPQLRPHAPQLLGSTRVSLQTFPHAACPTPHDNEGPPAAPGTPSGKTGRTVESPSPVQAMTRRLVHSEIARSPSRSDRSKPFENIMSSLKQSARTCTRRVRIVRGLANLSRVCAVRTP
jgi:hypothetical protein